MARAITLYEPWASAVAFGLKQIETRSWPTTYRGLLLIHAGKHVLVPSDEVVDAIAESHAMRGWDATRTMGRIVAVASLVSCRRSESFTDLSNLERTLGNFAPMRYGFELQDVQRLLYPIPARGFQGLWRPTEDLINQVLNAKRVKVK